MAMAQLRPLSDWTFFFSGNCYFLCHYRYRIVFNWFGLGMLSYIQKAFVMFLFC